MPPSLLEILRKTEAFFAKANLANPRLEAEWLLATVLECRRLDLYLKFDQPMGADVLDRLRPLVARRARREPLQYILGETPFADLQLSTDARALIPRPETELLVDHLVAEGRARPPKTILDLGTGTGAIALALAKAFPQAEITAVDRSEDALELARSNARRNDLQERVTWLASDWMSALGATQFDWIVSNPPYLTDEEWETAEPEVRGYEPRGALVAGREGLSDLLHLVDVVWPHLAVPGLLALETGIAHHAQLEQRSRERGYRNVESLKDDTGRPRFFWARRGEG